MKDKELAVTEWLEMIKKSWTWAKLSVVEQNKFLQLLEHPCSKVVLKGSYEQRWEACEALYHTFLDALGYDPLHWRESQPTVTHHYELNYKHHGLEFKPLTITDEAHAKSLARSALRDSSNSDVTLSKVTIKTERMII